MVLDHEPFFCFGIYTFSAVNGRNCKNTMPVALALGTSNPMPSVFAVNLWVGTAIFESPSILFLGSVESSIRKAVLYCTSGR